MRRYGHQCQTLFGLFNSFSLSLSLSLFIYDSFFSLFLFFFFLSLPHFIFLVSPLFLFFSSSFFLQDLHLSHFLAFFSTLFSFLSLSLHLLYLFFFPYHSPSLSFFFFYSPRQLPLRLADTVEFGLAMEFNLADEAVVVEISDFDLPLFFSFSFFPLVVDSM